MPKLVLKVGEERPIATPKAFLNILSASAQFIVESPDIGVLTGKANRYFEMGDYRNVFFVNNTDTPIEIDYEIANIRTTSSGEADVNVKNEVVVKRIVDAIQVDVEIKGADIHVSSPRVECLPGIIKLLKYARPRKSLRLNIRSDQANGVSIGGYDVSDVLGGYLDVGMVDYIQTNASLYAFNNGLEPVFVDVLELM